ncbi:MAG: DNA primase, partial [Geminicoccaceae bacterium]|nr:DNA primase [Geminicoccaceae bacterium]
MNGGRAPRDIRARLSSTGSLEEFRARLPLAEIVGRWVKLVRRGREWVGLCPFHQEKTPSFAVVEDKGFYHCFGCGAHGDAIGFVMAIERLDFKEALARLEELTGIPAPRRAAAGGERLDRALYDANAAAARWFAARLEAPEAAAARAYLAGRGLDPATIRTFGLGWAPADRGALRTALSAQGFTDETLVAAGLLRRPEGGGTPYALFRERVIFPIADARGRIVGFGGRTLGDGQPKYLNTPDTELFHKSRLLYGLDRAAEAARKSGRLVVAEGYMDVIALARAGLPAVAPLGTAMGEAQLEAAWKLASCPIVCLDGDTAGLRAALRLAERAAPALRADRSLAFVVLPEGEDPDSLMRAHGAAALLEALARPEPLASFFFRVALAQRAERLERAEERAALRRTLRDFLARIVDRDLRASLAEEFAALLASEFARRRLDPRGLGGPRP